MNELTVTDLAHRYLGLAAMAQNLDSMTQNVAQGEGLLAMAETLGASEKITAIGLQLKEARDQQRLAHDLMANKVGKPTIDGILTHVQDMGNRLELVKQLQQRWLQVRSNYELAAELGQFASDDDRTNALDQLNNARRTLDTAMQQLDKLFVRISLLLPA